MNIGNRLHLIASMITNYDSVIDIGTDHAYLPIYLIREKKSPRVIATEIRKGPYKKAEYNIMKAGLEDFIELRFGSGFCPITPGDAVTAVISGMGGGTICNIIKAHPQVANSFKYLVLQPMTNQALLRRRLFHLGYKIVEEDVAIEGSKYYEVMVVKKHDMVEFNETDVVVGPVLCKKKAPQVLEYLNMRKQVLERVIKSLNKANTENSRAALCGYKRELEMLREVIK